MLLQQFSYYVLLEEEIAKLPANIPIEDFDKVVIPKEEYRELKKAQVLLRAVKDAGYLDGHAGAIVLGIANTEHKYHLM